MKKCAHIDLIFEEINQSNNVNNIDNSNDLNNKSKSKTKIETICSLLLELNHFSKYKADLKNENKKPFKYLNCENCCLNQNLALVNETSFSRLHLCASCLYFGCFSLINNSHMEQHSLSKNHPITIDIIYGAFYCFLCKDFQYSQDIEEFLNAYFLKENFLPYGKFTEWEPSQKTLKILKKLSSINNACLSSSTNSNKIVSNSNIAFTILKSFKLKTSSIIGLRGLINLGNTCFMNCILQTLTHIPSLRDYFLGDQHICSFVHKSKSVCLVCEIVTLFQEFYSGKRSPYIPFRLLHQVWTQVKHLAGYEQQDAHEFFIAALNAIHKNFIENDTKCISLNKDKKKFINYNNCHCVIDKIFTGGLQSDVICSNCNNKSTTVDPFWDISLDIFKNTNKNIKNSSEILKLEDCLLKFTLPEILTSFNCSNCKCSREAKKQFTMKKLPIVCCFHLKRFEQTNRIHKKISDHIVFPEILDMNPFMSNNLTDSDVNYQARSEANRYFLFAVVNHHGTLESGHYTSFIRLKNEQWFKCDDHIISKASLTDVMNSEGYLLFYHKIWNEYE